MNKILHSCDATLENPMLPTFFLPNSLWLTMDFLRISQEFYFFAVPGVTYFSEFFLSSCVPTHACRLRSKIYKLFFSHFIDYANLNAGSFFSWRFPKSYYKFELGSVVTQELSQNTALLSTIFRFS